MVKRCLGPAVAKGLRIALSPCAKRIKLLWDFRIGVDVFNVGI